MRIIEMAAQLGQSPDEIVIFGIEPESVELGPKLSDSLLSRVEEYIAEIARELASE